MNAHTPGPWLVGFWGGLCDVPEHADSKHPGAPHCVYASIFYPTPDKPLGISGAEPNTSVVGIKYDELLISPEDARLISAAPDLLAALDALMHAALEHSESECVESAMRVGKACHAAQKAIDKAEGR